MIEIFLFSAVAFIILTFLRNALINYLVFTPAFAVMFILMIFFAAATTYFLKFQKSLFGFSSKHLLYVSFLLFLLSFGGSDSFLFLKASENNIAISVEEYDAEFAELKSHSAKTETKVNAEDLFFDKCVSCHSFDKNGVGPAFNQVIPKYKGKNDDLKNFLLSPVKIDPKYPQMPNQGLKPAEAKAIAEYLFQELGIK
jgi:cytochrome c